MKYRPLSASAITAAIILTCSLFMSCGAPLTPSEYTAEPVTVIEIKTQFSEYAPDAEFINAAMTNKSDEEISFGSFWAIERLTDSGWMTLPYKQDTAWNSLAYIIMPGKTDPHRIYLDQLDAKLKPGTYRLVKRLSDSYACAEFEVTKEGVGTSKPYGYKALNKLPKDYSPEPDAIFTHNSLPDEDKSLQIERLRRFFESTDLGISDMLRLVSYTVEGDPIITDITLEKFGWTARITVTTDNTRDRFAANRTVTTSYFSRFESRSDGIYLTESADCYTKEQRIDFGGFTAEAAELIENSTENLTVLRGVYWSEDGINCVALTSKPLEYISSEVYGNGYGRSFTGEIADKSGIAKEIVRVHRSSDGSLLFICSTKNTDMLYYCEWHDCETGELLAYTGTQYEPVIDNETGDLMILE
ncbi:MAG: DUF4362 domain-containing protein [Clostridiales bacterium]|nr:DUF4362 domain-containing protein [Clostridiales bacterium]